MLFQIALFTFALFAILKTRRQYLAREVSKYWLITFTCLWILVLVVAAIPNSTGIIADFVGIGRGADVVVYSAIVVLTYAVYKLVLREQKHADDMTALVRAFAIERAEKPEENR